MRGNVIAGMLAGAPMADASGSIPAGAMPRSAAYPLWAEVVGNWNTLDGDDNAAKTRSHTAGIYLGGDVPVGKGWRVGGALGFNDGRITADAVGWRSDVRSYTATVYGGNQRSEERRVGKGGVRKGRYRWWTNKKKKKN